MFQQNYHIHLRSSVLFFFSFFPQNLEPWKSGEKSENSSGSEQKWKRRLSISPCNITVKDERGASKQASSLQSSFFKVIHHTLEMNTRSRMSVGYGSLRRGDGGLRRSDRTKERKGWTRHLTLSGTKKKDRRKVTFFGHTHFEKCFCSCKNYSMFGRDSRPLLLPDWIPGQQSVSIRYNGG